MSAPRRCQDCTHTVGQHSHLVPHPCKADRCGCGSYERISISSISTLEVPKEGTTNG
jgi:hypothetical protein